MDKTVNFIWDQMMWHRASDDQLRWLWHTLRCIKSRTSDLSSMSWLKLSTLSEKLFCAYCSNIALSTPFPVIGWSKRESGLIREHNTWLHWSTVYVVYGIVSELVDDVWSVLGLWEANTNYHQYPIFCNFLLMIHVLSFTSRSLPS